VKREFYMENFCHLSLWCRGLQRLYLSYTRFGFVQNSDRPNTLVMLPPEIWEPRMESM
jgi:hypothetical protein